MPGKLAHYLPDVAQADRDALYASITSVVAYPRGDPIREGVISGMKFSVQVKPGLIDSAAYSDVMHTMLIVATVIAIIPIFLSLGMPNWFLGDTQNAVVTVNLAGEPADEDNARTLSTSQDSQSDKKVQV